MASTQKILYTPRDVRTTVRVPMISGIIHRHTHKWSLHCSGFDEQTVKLLYTYQTAKSP